MPIVAAGRPTALCGLPCTTSRADALENLETKYPSCRFALNRQRITARLKSMNLVLVMLKFCLAWLLPAPATNTSRPRTRFASNPLAPQAQPVPIRITPDHPPQVPRRH